MGPAPEAVTTTNTTRPRGGLRGRHTGKMIKKRTKTGCRTCRDRRIKCDEEHPRCSQCIKSARICEYNTPLAFRTVTFSQPPRDQSLYAPGPSNAQQTGMPPRQHNPAQRVALIPNSSMPTSGHHSMPVTVADHMPYGTIPLNTIPDPWTQPSQYGAFQPVYPTSQQTVQNDPNTQLQNRPASQPPLPSAPQFRYLQQPVSPASSSDCTSTNVAQDPLAYNYGAQSSSYPFAAASFEHQTHVGYTGGTRQVQQQRLLPRNDASHAPLSQAQYQYQSLYGPPSPQQDWYEEPE